MAESGGHWNTLAEAQKLTQSTLVPGIVETDIKRGNPLDRLPVAQAANSGLSIDYVKEAATTEEQIALIDIGEQLAWSENVTYTTGSLTLKRCYIQRKLDNFVQSIYGNINNYRATVLMEMEKGLKRKIGDWTIYGDLTYSAGNKEWDGLHAIAAERGTSPGTPTGTNIDQNGALSCTNLRLMIDSMKQGIDEIWLSYPVNRRIDAAYQEKGFVGLATATAGTMASISVGWNEAGKRMTFWDGIPMIPTDFLVLETDGTGTGATSDARAKNTAGTTYSIFFVKFGNMMQRQPGITFAYGGTEGAGDLYRLDLFPKLEDYDAEGMRMITYGGMLWSSNFSLGRIFDVTDAAIVV